jgi:hypothetical protein
MNNDVSVNLTGEQEESLAEMAASRNIGLSIPLRLLILYFIRNTRGEILFLDVLLKACRGAQSLWSFSCSLSLECRGLFSLTCIPARRFSVSFGFSLKFVESGRILERAYDGFTSGIEGILHSLSFIQDVLEMFFIRKYFCRINKREFDRGLTFDPIAA